MRALIAGIGDLQNHVPSQAALNVEIPLLVVNGLQSVTAGQPPLKPCPICASRPSALPVKKLYPVGNGLLKVAFVVIPSIVASQEVAG